MDGSDLLADKKWPAPTLLATALAPLFASCDLYKSVDVCKAQAVVSVWWRCNGQCRNSDSGAHAPTLCFRAYFGSSTAKRVLRATARSSSPAWTMDIRERKAMVPSNHDAHVLVFTVVYLLQEVRLGSRQCFAPVV